MADSSTKFAWWIKNGCLWAVVLRKARGTNAARHQNGPGHQWPRQKSVNEPNVRVNVPSPPSPSLPMRVCEWMRSTVFDEPKLSFKWTHIKMPNAHRIRPIDVGVGVEWICISYAITLTSSYFRLRDEPVSIFISVDLIDGVRWAMQIDVRKWSDRCDWGIMVRVPDCEWEVCVNPIFSLSVAAVCPTFYDWIKSCMCSTSSDSMSLRSKQ